MARIPSTIAIVTVAAVVLGLNTYVSASFAAEQTVRLRAVDDQKAVIATVEPVHELLARARIGGTITSLAVKEGDRVTAGDQIAVIADQKLLLQMQALQSRVQAQQANRDQAQINFVRIQKLRAASVSSQAQVDQAKTSLDVAERPLQALLSDRQVVQEQASQGAALAPGTGHPHIDGEYVARMEDVLDLYGVPDTRPSSTGVLTSILCPNQRSEAKFGFKLLNRMTKFCVPVSAQIK